MTRRSLRRTTVAAVCAGSTLLVSAAVPAWAYTRALAAPTPAARPGGSPAVLVHGLRNSTVRSTNWAGYATFGGGLYNSVSTTFRQPPLNCARGDGYSSFWVGIDGFRSDSVEQTGTEADCRGGAASYSGWYEIYPNYPVTFSDPVRPGDVMRASVAYVARDTFNLRLTDLTRGWARSVTQQVRGATRSSAEVIVEAPFSDGVLPMADFGQVRFTGSLVNGRLMEGFRPRAIDMVSARGVRMATTFPLRGGSFPITWSHS